jgi:cytidyltransferase-like protein
MKKVLVVGFFDMFHSGHVEFFQQASKFGKLYVSIATDQNSIINKHKAPVYTEIERKFMVDSCKYVHKSFISYGRTDTLSFEDHMIQIKPDIFIINEDGHTTEKKNLCDNHGIQYIVLQRTPRLNLPTRSTSNIRLINQIPLRLDFVSFFDQIALNSISPGSVVVANIHPVNVEPRSGMCTSTLNTIIKLFGNKLPTHIGRYELSKILHVIENLNNSKYISGAVDQIGICYSGITKMTFNNSYWPHILERFTDKSCIDWLNKYLYIVQTKQRPTDFKLYNGDEMISKNLLTIQNELVNICLTSIKDKNINLFGQCINQVHKNQKQIWSNYESEYCKLKIQQYQKNHIGCKLLGAGGYGYAMIVTESPESHFIKVNITK